MGQACSAERMHSSEPLKVELYLSAYILMAEPVGNEFHWLLAFLTTPLMMMPVWEFQSLWQASSASGGE